MSDHRLTCTIHPVGPGDTALAASVRRDLAARGVLVLDTARGGPGTLIALTVCADPGRSASSMVEQLARRFRRVLVVIGASATANGLIWQLLSCGASDVLSWRPTEEPGVAILLRLQRWNHIDANVGAPSVSRQLVGQSNAWLTALRRVVEISSFTTSSLLLTGESGTGKELVARLFHHLDPREGKRDLIVVDCTTIVPTLSGSEFFGHERGAFTGAMSAREGAFAAADRGTLFLDEVGELPLTMQAELLRVIQEGTYKRVGADKWRTTRFRLVCATNRDLTAELAAGRFRLDLFHRLASNVVRLPPLRERSGDILPLFAYFLTEAFGSDPDVHPAVAELLEQRDYPGNVRDLRQLALRIAARHVGPGPVTPGDIPEEERPVGLARSPGEWATGLLDQAVAAALRDGRGYREIRDAAADCAVRLSVERAGGNLRAAAQQLGVTDRMLQQRRAVGRTGVPLAEPTPAREPPTYSWLTLPATAPSRDPRAQEALQYGWSAPTGDRSVAAPWTPGAAGCRRGQGVAGRGASPARAPWPAPHRGAATGRPSRTAPCAGRPGARPRRADRSGAPRRCRCGHSDAERAGRGRPVGPASRRRSCPGAG